MSRRAIYLYHQTGEWLREQSREITDQEGRDALVKLRQPVTKMAWLRDRVMGQRRTSILKHKLDAFMSAVYSTTINQRYVDRLCPDSETKNQPGDPNYYLTASERKEHTKLLLQFKTEHDTREKEEQLSKEQKDERSNAEAIARQKDIWVKVGHLSLSRSVNLPQIDSQGKLDDDVMSLCGNLLKEQFINSLSTSSFQLVHDNGKPRTELHKNDFQFMYYNDHYVLVYHPANTTTAIVMDSLQVSKPFESKRVVSKLFNIYGEITAVRYNLQTQPRGSVLCGYYSIATAVSLLKTGVVDDSKVGDKVQFDHQKIHTWLKECLEAKEFTLCPTFDSSATQPPKQKKARKKNTPLD